MTEKRPKSKETGRRSFCAGVCRWCAHHLVLSSPIHSDFIPTSALVSDCPIQHYFTARIYRETSLMGVQCKGMASLKYCRAGFDSDGQMAAKIAMIAIIGISCTNCAHYNLHRSCLPIYGMAIVRSL